MDNIEAMQNHSTVTITGSNGVANSSVYTYTMPTSIRKVANGWILSYQSLEYVFSNTVKLCEFLEKNLK